MTARTLAACTAIVPGLLARPGAAQSPGHGTQRFLDPSQDAGAFWTLVGAPQKFVFSLAQAPDTSKTLYAASADKRLLKSQDGGLTWRWIDLPGPRPDNIAASVVAVADGVVWVGTTGFNHKAGDGLFVSQDGETNFTPCKSDIPGAGMNALPPEAGAKTPTVPVGFNGLGGYEARAPKTEH